MVIMAITATHKTTGPLSPLKLSMTFHRQGWTARSSRRAEIGLQLFTAKP